jgi:hypothetical protein
VDDDCEIRFGTNANCDHCGDTCADPAKPCIYDDATHKGKCGCDDGLVYCGGACVDPLSDDDNCGTCNHVCADPADAGALAPNTHYGCGGGACGHVKCNSGHADCDGQTLNGCEASLSTNTTCGSCKIACPAGENCLPNVKGTPVCKCPPGQTLCGTTCVDLGTDPRNCGACNLDCTITAANKNGVGLCNYGSCAFHCAQGWGDCNGDPKDGCEVNLGSDQNNCGACGNACDVFGGQPCIAAACAIAPCGDGGTTR